jgi:MOSC domain-containing protein YiiM
VSADAPATVAPEFLTRDQLEAGLDEIRRAPADAGTLELIVRRPAVDEREVLEVGELSEADGLAGDTWKVRSSSRTDDGSAHPDMQLNVISARLIALVSPEVSRRPLAGDQLLVDLDISEENMPPGTRLAIGDAVIEVTEQPHTGCQKFSSRFGLEALRFVNSPVGRRLRLRGLNAKVVQPGTITRGDAVRKV